MNRNPEQASLDLQPPMEGGIEVEKKGFVIEKGKEIRLGIGLDRKSGFVEIPVIYPDGRSRKVFLTIHNYGSRKEEVSLSSGKELDEKTMAELKDFVFSLFNDKKYEEGEHIINEREESTSGKRRNRDGKMAAAGDLN